MKKEFIKARVATINDGVNLVYTLLFGQIYLRATDILMLIGYKKSSCPSVVKRRCENVKKIYFQVDGMSFRKVQTNFINVSDIEEVLRTTRLNMDTNHKSFLTALVEHLKQLNTQIKAPVVNGDPTLLTATHLPKPKNPISVNETLKIKNNYYTNNYIKNNNNNSCCNRKKPLKSFQKLRMLANNITLGYKDYFKNNGVVPPGDFGADVVNAAMETLELKLVGNAFYNVYLEMLETYGYNLDNIVIKKAIDDCASKILEPIFIAMGWEYKVEYSTF